MKDDRLEKLSFTFRGPKTMKRKELNDAQKLPAIKLIILSVSLFSLKVIFDDIPVPKQSQTL